MKKAILPIIVFIFTLSSKAQLVVAPNQTATNLANYLLGGGVTITNAVLTCPAGANAIFTNGSTTNLGLNSGIVLTTGSAANIAFPASNNSSINNGTAGIPGLSPITGTSNNYDGCQLEFDINPQCSPLNIKYKFASEEYPEYVHAGYNDAFGFFISGPNPLGGNYTNYDLATVPGTGSPVTIDNINSSSNSAYYIPNYSGTTIVYDGMTTVLTGSANVVPCANYHLILAITDGGDPNFDSGVFLQQSGISCISPTVNVAGATICAGQSATLTASGTTTYSWSTGSTSSSIVVSPAVTTTYTVGGSNIGTCIQSSKVVTVTVNSAPTAIAGPAKGLTCVTTATVLSGSGGGSYSWSGPGILSGGSSASPTVNQAGTYSLIVTVAGCPSLPSTVAVTQNTTAPSVTSSSGILNCTLTSVSAVASTTTAPATFNWSGPGITGGGATSNVTVNQPGTYNYTVTGTNGCTTTGSQSIIQNIAVPAATSGVSGILNCTLTSVNATSSTTTTPVAFNWSGPGITGGGATSSATVNQPGTYNYTITNSSNGCTTTGSQAVTQNINPPTVTSSASAVLNCTLTSVNATASTTTTPVTYNWSGPGITGGGTTSNITVNQPGTYNYTVTATNGCTGTGSQAVTQNIATPSVTSASGILNCTLTSVNATASTTATPVSYSWSGPGITGGGTTSAVTVNQPGTYNYTVTTSNGCINAGSQLVTQNTATPSITMPATQTITCSAPSVTLIASASPATSIPAWTGGVSSGINSYTATASSANTYTLSVTDPANGCTKSGIVQVVPNAGFPSVTAGTTNSINCTVTSAQVVASTSTTPVSYSWTGPGITSGATTATASVNTGGQYTVVVTNTISACSSTITIGVASNTTPITPSISATGSITCFTPTLNLTGMPAVNVTYTWTGTGLTSNINLQTVTINAGGTYTLNITDATTGCIGSQAVTISTNTTAPTVNLTVGSFTTTCAAPTATFNAIANPAANTTYSWTSPPTGALNSYTISNPTANGSGVFTVAVTNTINGCSTSATSQGTVSVIADSGAPVASISQSTASLTCNTSTQSATITTNPAANITYTWSPPPATGLNSSVATFTAPGTYVCSLTNTVNSCPATTQIVIVTNTTAPTIVITPAVSLNCTSPTSSINSTVTAASTLTWLGSGIVGANNGFSISVNSAGTYTLIALNAVNGCTAVATSTVTDNTTRPTLSVIPSTTLISCSTPTLNLNAVTNSTATPVWNTPSGNAYNPIVAGTAGIYTVTVTDPQSGCTNSLTIAVGGSTIIPTINVMAATSIPCGASSVTLTAISSVSTGVTYSWAVPGSGSITSGSNTPNPTVTGVGVYTVTASNSNGCTSTTTVNVTQGNITASFTANPTSGISPLIVNYTNTSTGATAYNWDFGNGSPNNNSINANNTFTAQGSYTVVLTATTGSCISTATAVIVVEDAFSLEIPNVFTPNNDGSNDIFTIKSTGVKEISLQIFNRWGEKLFEFTGAKAAWDGMTPQGAKVPDATYFYFVNATGFDNTKIEKHGTVNLFR